MMMMMMMMKMDTGSANGGGMAIHHQNTVKGYFGIAGSNYLTGSSANDIVLRAENRLDVAVSNTKKLDVNGGGLNVSGIVTATTFVGALTGNVTGNVTGDMVGAAVTTDSQGIRAAGIITATSFSGPGNIPGNVTTGAYSIVAADAGKLVSATGTVTLPAATFEVGDAISVYNNTGSDMTLTCSAPTAVYLGSDGSTVTSLTLALRCICTFVCVDSASNGSFVAAGGGLS